MIDDEQGNEIFDYNEDTVRDRMMHYPIDVASICRFFIDVMVVCNVITAKEFKENNKNCSSAPLFASCVATLFETVENKTSTQPKENIAFYGKTFILYELLIQYIGFLIYFYFLSGMMAMLLVRFSYKITTTMFYYRHDKNEKGNSEDLEQSIINRMKYCLVKHLLLLIDNFGLFPTLKD